MYDLYPAIAGRAEERAERRAAQLAEVADVKQAAVGIVPGAPQERQPDPPVLGIGAGGDRQPLRPEQRAMAGDDRPWIGHVLEDITVDETIEGALPRREQLIELLGRHDLIEVESRLLAGGVVDFDADDGSVRTLLFQGATELAGGAADIEDAGSADGNESEDVVARIVVDLLEAERRRQEPSS